VIYVYGKKTGETNLITLTSDKTVRSSVKFRVTVHR
jgi:Flp pilus assembly secretin CpaC